MRTQELKNKKVLILGFAREGRDVLRYLQKHFPGKVVGVADEKESLPRLPKRKVRLHLGKRYLSALAKYDVVVRSPGVPLRMLEKRLGPGQKLTSETDIFFSEFKGTIVGITGTKGKSTTASLICSILKKGGRKAVLLGNIGIPSLRFLSKQMPEHIAVYELSSFQLEGSSVAPHVAVLLNVFPEHLNHHGSFAKYAGAKANIAKRQGPEDFLIYNQENKTVRNIAKLSLAQKIPYKPKKRGNAFAAFLEPALLAGKLFSIPDSLVKKAIKEFKPLSHRLELVGTHKGIAFVNDSLATIPEAAAAALDILGNNVATLIAGGYDRGVDMKKLARRIEKSGVETLILFPDTGEKIARALKKKPKNVLSAENMQKAVRLAYEHTKRGKTCLLSPAASSFNLFRDYKDRGEQFKKYVKLYAGKKER